MAYLIAHEIAHTFKSMRDFHAFTFNEFMANAGRGLKEAEAHREFVFTPGFVEVEARANTIAQEIYRKFRIPYVWDRKFSFTPTNGFAKC